MTMCWVKYATLTSYAVSKVERKDGRERLSAVPRQDNLL